MKKLSLCLFTFISILLTNTALAHDSFGKLATHLGRQFSRHSLQIIEPFQNAPAPSIEVLLKNYIASRSPQSSEDFHLLFEPQDGINTDTPEIGILTFETAVREVSAALKNTVKSPAALAHKTNMAEEDLQKLTSLGAVFAYDAWQQNGCAAPTPYLLILDAQGGKVYGIDLQPCQQD